MPDSANPTPEHSLPEPVRMARPARRLRDAFEPVAMHNAGYTATLERAGAPGLDRFAAYVRERRVGRATHATLPRIRAVRKVSAIL